MIWLALALAYSAVAFFALAMVPHYRTVFRHIPNDNIRQLLRASSGTLAFLSAFAGIAAQGWQAGLIAWIAMLSLSGFVVTQLLTFAPRWLFAPATSLLVVSLAALVWT